MFWARAAWAKSIVHATPGLIVPWPSRSCRPKRPTIPNAAGVSIWKRARFPAFPTPISARCSVGHDSGVDYLVMEYLEGETLKERLKRGPLPVDHVLRIGAEIADALGKAHRGGIVHRDLKPANVMLTKSGAKLLDFGLARFCSRIETGSLAGDQTLTESERLTEPGAILGTWQYMAPEQLEARETDARTDIFALGALLFEMATARHAFPGKGRAAVIAAILSSEPPAISKLREASPTALDHVVKVCLAKEPDERWQNAYDVASQLKFISNAVQHPVLAQGGRRQTLKWIAASAALLLVGAVTGFLLLRSRSAGFTAHTMRFSIRPPDRTSFDVVVLSPDGRHLAFTADGTNEVRGLWVRSLDSEDFARVLGTEDASNPFWSPDSRSIAFFTKDKLKRVEAAGGTPEILCSVSHVDTGDWNRQQMVLFTPGLFLPLNQLNLSDCTVRPATRYDAERHEVANVFGRFLPDQRHFLWVANRIVPDKGVDVYVSSLDSDERRLLIHNASFPSYVLPGYILFTREGKLLAQDFDLKALKTSGEPFPIVRNRLQSNHFDGYSFYSVSQNGTLVYLPEVFRPFRLGWRDRSGKPVGNYSEDGTSSEIQQLSPDGNSVLLSVFSPETQLGDIWTHQFRDAMTRKITSNPVSSGGRIVRSPDGRQVLYSSRQEGIFTLRRRFVDGSGTEEELVQSARWIAPRAWSPDGRFVLYQSVDPQSGYDLFVLPLFGDKKPIPFLQTQFNEGHAVFAPNGRWVAYLSDQSGRYEVYVRPFPDPGKQWQISSGIAGDAEGGSPVRLRWSRDGKELFYLAADWTLMSVPITIAGDFHAGVPRPMFALGPGAQFDVAPDGKKFLVNSPLPDAQPVPLNVVVNWSTEFASR